MHLEGTLVRLRTLRVEDAEDQLRWGMDPGIMPEAARHTLTIDGQRAWIERVLDASDSAYFAIETRSGTHIGIASLHDIQRLDRTAELAIHIGERDAWGHGFGREASELLLAHGFGALQLNCIWLKVRTTNTRAVQLYECLGFHLEGTLRARLLLAGTFEDEHVMSLLASEWAARPSQ